MMRLYMGKKAAYFFAILVIILVAVGVYLINPFSNKIKSGLQVVTTGSKASLFLNDQYLDKTPYINKQIVPGEYTLRIVPDDQNLAAYETPVTLHKGSLSVVGWKPGKTVETSSGTIYELESLDNKNQTEISFVTIPDNAIIRFDDGERLFAPTILKNVNPGRHEFEVSLPSYETQENNLQAVAGYRLNITIILGREDILNGADKPQETGEELDSQQETATDSARDKALAGEGTPSGDLSSQLTIRSTNYFLQGKEVLRVRLGAGLESDPVGFVESGESYPYIEQSDNNWYKIEFEDALTEEPKEGWISGEFAEISED